MPAKPLSVDRAMKEAKRYEAAGALQDAAKVYNAVLARFPANKRAAEALRSLEQRLPRPLRPDPCMFDVDLRRLIGAMQRGDLTTVLNDGPKLAERVPGHPIVPNVIGAALSAAGRYEEAIAHYEAALALDPGMGPALNNLGAALAELGRYDEAEARYRFALERQPDYPQARNNLANTLQATARTGEAIAEYREAIRLKSDFYDAHLGLGRALAANGDVEAARVSLETACRLSPTDAACRNTLGTILLRLDRTVDAVKAFEEALRLDPTLADAQNNLGNALNAQGDRETAIKAYQAAIALRPNQVEAYGNLCDLYDKANQVEALRQAVTAGIDACGPDEPQIRVWQAELAARDDDHSTAANLLEKTSRVRLPLRVQLRHAELLGKSLDRLGRHDAAFETFRETNRLAERFQSFRSYDAAGYIAELRDLRVTWEAADGLEWRSGPVGGNQLAFMVGMPRSGTTLLDTILSGHPEISVVEEGPMLATAGAELGGLGTPDRLSNLDAGSIEDLRTVYLDTLFAATGTGLGESLVIDKLPLNLAHMGLIKRLFPEAPVILVIRHPCDCVLSCFMQNFRLNDAMANFLHLETTAEIYDHAMAIGDAVGRSTAQSPLTLRYEDLVTDLRGTVEPVLSALGLDWNDGILAYQSTAASRQRINTPSYKQVTQDLYTRSSGRWENYREQMEPVLPVLAPWISRWGYDV